MDGLLVLAEALERAGKSMASGLVTIAEAVGDLAVAIDDHAGAPCLVCQGAGRLSGNDVCEACDGTGWKRPPPREPSEPQEV